MKLLLIEDNPDHVALVIHALRQSGERPTIVHEELLVAGEARLRAGEVFDAILLDMSLPDANGVDNVSRLEAVNGEVPIVVLTSLDDSQTAAKTLKTGAQDYLIKDKLTTSMLTRSLRHAIQRQTVRVENQHLVEKLQAAQELLERKNERLNKLYRTSQQFLDNVSHEFRTPLTVIKEYSALMRDEVVGPVNDDQDQMLHVVEDRAEDLNTMVDDMLDVSRLEAGVMGLTRRTCRFEEILQRVMPALVRKAEVKGVELSFDLEESLPKIFCDGEKIGRVLTNLVVNAIKFATRPGKVTVRADYDATHREVCVAVTDNGPGIDQQGLTEIFERFKQVGVGARGSCKGFGLGLNIAKEMVDLNFGEMSVVSKLNEGSVFSFTIPIALPAEVVSRYLTAQRQCRQDSNVTLMVASVNENTPSELADESDSFLNHAVRSNDLAFRIDDHHWLLVMAVDDIEVHRFTTRMKKAQDDANRNRPFDALPQLDFQRIGSWPCIHRDAILAEIETQLAESNEAEPFLQENHHD